MALLADYVGVDDGTGIVHNSPGHGVDDYFACLKEGITDICMPVDDDGKFYTGEEFGTGGPFSGMDTDEANPHIIEFLRERGTLVLEKKITHSYPHCWRCKHPVLFRATDQWFVSMDKTGLREQAGKEVRENVKWYPAHAANRIGAMVEQRPDWCISRQRNWGVPIPSYTCADCGEKVMNDATLDAVIKLFHEKGSDAWFTDAPESYLGEACVCPKCGGHHLKADKDILDVWWDSGVSWKAVCEYRPELEYPADVYLEGSDQHRGWFQSSLLTSVGANGHAPYKAVVSQGFTLDGQGRKMSKSLGNVIDPNKVCDEMGADIIRLWVASVDTSSDVSIDHEILARTSDAYRRFRNTLRFLLSELEGQFEPETDGVAFADLLPLDKLMVARLTQVQRGRRRLCLLRVPARLPCALRLRGYRAFQRVPRRLEGPSVLREARLTRAPQRPDRARRALLDAHARPAADPVLHRRRGHGLCARRLRRSPEVRRAARLVQVAYHG
mgnify:FL=1